MTDNYEYAVGKVREMVEEYKNDNQISEALNLPVGMIKDIRRENDIPGGYQLRTMRRKCAIIKNLGKSVDELIELTGLSKSGLKSMMERMRDKGVIEYNDDIFFEGKNGKLARKVSESRKKNIPEINVRYTYWPRLISGMPKWMRSACNAAREERLKRGAV